MRVLHTADWHLGQHFLTGQERTDEHKAFLDWLIGTVKAHGVDVLVVAGDIFDSQSPSHAAQGLYYDFLVQMLGTGCRHIVIVGGNHDSPTMLNASRQLLRHLQVHVIGGVPQEPAEQVLVLENETGRPGLVVCAVPFLRDRDIRLSVAGETADERHERVRQAIAGHYTHVAGLAAALRHHENGVPVLATGHLYAAGGEASEGAERDVHIGGLGSVSADQFPELFDYVALGHLHRPQQVGGRAHIRYSGSPVPLSFAEAAHQQQVVLLTLDAAGQPVTLEYLPVPLQRQLVRFRGSREEVEYQIMAFDNQDRPLVAWADVEVVSDELPSEIHRAISAAFDTRRGHIEAPRTPRVRRQMPEQDLARQSAPTETLQDLTVAEVFARRISTLPEAQRTALTDTFRELCQLMEQSTGEPIPAAPTFSVTAS
ncbi:Exodeoxyribonuclease I subunit D [Hymenobacter daecheongensis DSM 21074]|uniref:Nuclease SbcCD subunit D n=1 Tax=Hymenobacter daecheongensis DSM 21074 TaxID=1121955 RepID=A0A1M6M1U6_9BACT|nr:exonuclease subunit SbcD [Hymenobacter daecheongensis]SHJ77330.1 Exodeoxyribonuclease I subunit D [Hymenobacter daecheongensis DSM 21074]